MPRYDCSLWSYLKRFHKNTTQQLSLKRRFVILNRIVEAIWEIQSLGICHLDIKPSNILINLDNNGHWDPNDQNNLVLSDFGLAGNCDTVRE